MRSARPCSVRRSPPGCMRTPSAPAKCARASSPACPRAGSANPPTSPGRCCSSPRAHRTSTPATSSMPMAATLPAEPMAKTRIAVVGAGLMGHGIAQVFALAGHDVTLTDAHAPTLATAKARILANLTDLGEDTAALERVRIVPGLADCVREADFVVEAVREDLESKQTLFAEIEQAARPASVRSAPTGGIRPTSCRWSR